VKHRRAASPAADLVPSARPADAHALLTRTAARAAALDRATQAARTAAALEVVAPDWARPWWLDRQLRPAHAAFVPTGELGHVENVTGRSWTVLATASSGPLATVDPAGSVHPVGSARSLDWAVGAEDRWHRAATETTVRQRLVSHAPVVETVVKVPSGDAVARAYAIATGGAGGDAVVFEIENESPVPFVAVFALRPAHPMGVGAISSIRYEHPHVLVDERPMLLLDKPAARWSVSDAPHDALVEAMAGTARDGAFEPVRSTTGLATATFLLPVPHRTSVRVTLHPRAERRTRPERASVVPSAGQVARGWEAHTARAARIELPDRRVSDAYAAALRGLAAACAGGFPVPPGRENDWRVADEAAVVRALARAGMGDLAASILRRRCDEVELDSWLRREPASVARNLAVFDAVGAHWEASHDRSLVDDVLGAVVKAAHWVERARARRAVPLDVATAHTAARTLGVLSAAVRAAGQPDSADDLQAFAGRFLLDLDDREPEDGYRADDTSRHDDEPHPDDVPRTGAGLRPVAVESWRGLDTAATMRAAQVDIGAADELAFDRIEWLLRAAGPTTRWPTHVHPRLLTGTAGAGDDPTSAAGFVAVVRTLVVDDAQPQQLRLLPLVPPTWFGQSLDVHGLPTSTGVLSFALRWHGPRPAILWELAPHDASADITISAPGLDPSWSTHAVEGEALLAVPATPTPVALVAQPNSDHVPMTTLEPRVRREPANGGSLESAGPVAEPPEPGESFG
jgi:hypothetical protein